MWGEGRWEKGDREKREEGVGGIFYLYSYFKNFGKLS